MDLLCVSFVFKYCLCVCLCVGVFVCVQIYVNKLSGIYHSKFPSDKRNIKEFNLKRTQQKIVKLGISFFFKYFKFFGFKQASRKSTEIDIIQHFILFSFYFMKMSKILTLTDALTKPKQSFINRQFLHSVIVKILHSVMKAIFKKF